MNLKDRIILEDYRSSKADFEKLGETVMGILDRVVKEAGISVMAMEHRVKEENSLAGKLERKGDKYNSLEDITDILGCRVICSFEDDVDRIGEIVEKEFELDWENSVDKRATLRPDSFGYLSLHYICCLPEDKGYPKELCGKKFEIQIRTILQHAWAVINHDLGYKSDFGVPDAVTRDFSRIAGLFELADDEFVRTRDKVYGYTEDIRSKIRNDEADDVKLDSVSLNEYVMNSKGMHAFLESLASICGAEISWIDPESYLPLLNWLGVKDIGELQRMLSEDGSLAYELAVKTLDGSDLDILSSNVGLRFLCRAELLSKSYPEDRIIEFFELQTGKRDRAERQAKYLIDSYAKLKENK